MKRLSVLVSGAALLIAAGWLVLWGLMPCRLLDRLLARSGCIAAYEISDLTSLRTTIAFNPQKPSMLVVAGTSYRAGSGRELRTSSQIVLFDTERGRETARYELQIDGRIEQLALSPDGKRAAVTCNSRYTCDFAPMHVPEGVQRQDFIPVHLVDLGKWSDGRGDDIRISPNDGTWWIKGIDKRAAPPNADGRSVDIKFSEDGSAVLAGPVQWSSQDGASLPAAPEALKENQQGFDTLKLPADGGQALFNRDGRAVIVESGTEQRRLHLNLPGYFVDDLHLPLAISPDGRMVAALSRRFASRRGFGAVLQAWNLAEGRRIARIAISEDLFASLIWTPDSQGLVVAVASAPAVRASTELRLYKLGGGT